MVKKKKHIDINSIDKKNVFEVPENYFEHLHANILSKVSEEKTTVVSISQPGKSAIYLAIAATICGVFFFFWTPEASSFDTDKALAQIETSEIIAYLEDTEISEEEILTYYDVNAIAEKIDGQQDMINQLDVDDEAIFDLLDDMEIDNDNF